jgi:hypothetical protein
MQAVCFPISACADGGPILEDPELWALLEEGMQIAVVSLDQEDSTARVDLFISLLDASGVSHEITFFVPLGHNPTAFDVEEQNSFDFEAVLTAALDNYLLDAAEWEQDYPPDVRFQLLPGTLFVSGGWPWLLWAAMSNFWLMGLEGGVSPGATYETEHSVVELYAIDSDTNLDALISTSGLDPAVRDTLRRLEGQQIAVITMETQPAGEDEGDETGYGFVGLSGQQGLHLTWTAGLVADAYAYPLGTGSAWARPIELTRVYVVAPPDVDFRVDYPHLGEDRSGYTGSGFYRRLGPRIMGDMETPGYAVDQAVGDFGRVWRAIYVQSNAAEDVVVTRVDGLLPETRAVMRRHAFQEWVLRLTWVVGLLVAPVIWVVAWHLIMSWRLGRSYRWLDFTLWGQALLWNGVYLLSCVIALVLFGVITFGSFALSDMLSYDLAWIGRIVSVVSIIPVLIFLFLASFGLISGFFFVRHARRRRDVSAGRAAGAYALTILTSNLGYGLFALGYLLLVGGF